MKKIIHVFFVGIIVLFLMLGLLKTILFPDEINYLENRYANQIPSFSVEGYLEGSFQDQISKALNDQVPLASTMKQFFNYTNSYYENQIMSLVLKKDNRCYSSFKGGLMFGEFIVYETRDYEELKEYHDAKVLNIVQQIKKHPDVEFYVYYIEKDTDINFENNQKIGAYEYLEKEFEKNNILFNGFKVDDFDDFSQYFYRTDHHWNCFGSYKAYTEIIEWMEQEKDYVPIIDEYLLDYEFSGSKASSLGATGIVKEEFPAYEYAYPDMTIRIDGENVEDYGSQESYIREQHDTISYGAFYGGDNAEVVFDTHNDGKGNLLIIGESYDNAILKLLASHYEKTYSIDLRYYDKTFEKSFSFSRYIEEHSIDKVLLIGNIDYFTMEEFMLED